MKRTIVATVFSSVLLLSACSGPGPGEQLDTVLKETFEAEKEYRETQERMMELEQNEQETFESVMALTQEEQEEVRAKAEEALASVEERLELLETEKEAMSSAEENFAEIDTIIEDTEDEELKEDLTALKNQMQERYDAHAEFAAAYEEMTIMQQELYEMLLDEETNLQSLQEKTDEVNEQNTKVQEAVTVFNEETEQFNEMRRKTIEKINEDN